jgi:DNA-binding HxlR family transcriptional regulator
MHFNEIKRLLGISSNVLAKKLKQLEQEGLVTRRAVYENSPLRVEYKITPLGIRCHFHRLREMGS